MLVIDHFLRVRCCSKHFTERFSLQHIPVKHELSLALLPSQETEAWWDRCPANGAHPHVPVLSVPPRWAQDTCKSQASRGPWGRIPPALPHDPQMGTHGNLARCHQSRSHFSILENSV